MKKTISLLLTAIMVFSLVPALFVRDGLAADDKYVKNSTAAAINVYKEANDASQIVSTLPVGGVAKYVRSSGAFLKIENPAGYVKTSQVLLQSITLKAEGGIFLYDGCAYLKRLAAREDRMALHSLNPSYADILISPELPLRVLGKVLN